MLRVLFHTSNLKSHVMYAIPSVYISYPLKQSVVCDYAHCLTLEVTNAIWFSQRSLHCGLSKGKPWSLHFHRVQLIWSSLHQISGRGIQPHCKKGQCWNKASAASASPAPGMKLKPTLHFDLFINMVTSHCTTGLCWLNHVVHSPLWVTLHRFKHNPSYVMWPPSKCAENHRTLCVCY